MLCTLCPHRCGVNRAEREGRCHSGPRPVVAKAMAHMWEEPPISGARGSGTVFFCGCNMSCAFCQNHRISRDGRGEGLSCEALCDVFLRLAQSGVHNINLVSAGHFLPEVAKAVAKAKAAGIGIPFVYNTNAYELPEALAQLQGLIDVYLPDLKYVSEEAARLYSGAPNYFDVAGRAILEMRRQAPRNEEQDGVLKRGVLIRHLVLPGLRRDSMAALDWIARECPDTPVSLMAQYTPADRASEHPSINRRVTTFEYESVLAHFHSLGLRQGYMQNRRAAVSDYTPEF